MCFIFPVIYYGFAHIAGVKSSRGKESIQQRNPFCLKCLGLSTITIDVSEVPSSRGLGTLQYLDSFLKRYREGRKANTMNHYLAMYESLGQPNSCVT